MQRLFVVAENGRPINGVRLLKSAYPEFDTSAIDCRMRAMRAQRYKLIWHEGQKVELFDLETDPEETRDLAASQPQIRDELLGQLKGWMVRGASGTDAVLFESRDAESLEQLRSLGYVD